MTNLFESALAAVLLLCLHRCTAEDSIDSSSDIDKRTLDSIAAHSLDGFNKRQFDSIAYQNGLSGFAVKKSFDPINRGGLNGFVKRRFDSIADYGGMSGFNKKSFDPINRGGLNGFVKRPMDPIHTGGLSGFVKRAFDPINGHHFSGFAKRRFDLIDNSRGFNGFVKRDASGEVENDGN